MNLQDSANIAKELEEKHRKKRVVIASIILCAVLMAMLLCLIMFIIYTDANTLKVFVNGKQIKFSDSFFYTAKDGTRYVNVKDLASSLGITYTKGEYKKFNEDDDSCYLTQYHEIASMKAGENTYSKYFVELYDSTANNKQHNLEQEEEAKYGQKITVKNEQETKEVYNLAHPIEIVKGALYVSYEDVEHMFNIRWEHKETYRVRIYDLATVYAEAKTKTAKLGYEVVSGDYENIRAVIDGYMVVGETESNYGVIDLATGKDLISCSYESLVYLQNADEFFAYVDGTCGLFSADGKTIIKPAEFDAISVLDQALKPEDRLYLVEKNTKYGVLNRKGDVIIYPEYDQIGLRESDYIDPSNSNNSNIKATYQELDNTKILFNKIIPVKQKSKFGLYDIEGNELAKAVYDGIGFVFTERDANGNEENTTAKVVAGQKGAIIIPETVGIKGIVLNQSSSYGIYDAEVEKLIIPVVCSNVYSIIKNGTQTYYVTFNGTQLELSQYLKDNNLVSVKPKSTDKSKEKEENEETEDNKETGDSKQDTPVDVDENLGDGSENRRENSSDNSVTVEYSQTEEEGKKN